jgi:hypothetical protein
MFYIKNRITSDSQSKYLRAPCAEETCSIVCGLNINKCHSCQTAGNSNFTLFQMVYFFNAYQPRFSFEHMI